MTPHFRSLALALAVGLLAAGTALAARDSLSNEKIAADEEDALRDPRLLAQLTESGLRFVADEDGDACVRFRTGPGEEQAVTVLSGTSRILDLEMRDAFAVSVVGSGPVPEGLLEDLLLRNDDVDFGAWEWTGSESADKEWVVAFRAKMPARMTPASFKAALRLVAKAAAEYRAEHPEAAASPAGGGEGDGGDEPENLNFLRSPRRIK